MRERKAKDVQIKFTLSSVLKVRRFTLTAMYE